MAEPWSTTVTAFAVAARGPDWLMIRHERLGVTRWELPGGHVEPGETLEDAAARETVEETGVTVEVGRLLATCVHEWRERRQRKVICFFDARADGDAVPSAQPDEPGVLEAAWADPLQVSPISPFLIPLVEQRGNAWVGVPIFFHMTHHLNAVGLWEPAPVTRGLGS